MDRHKYPPQILHVKDQMLFVPAGLSTATPLFFMLPSLTLSSLPHGLKMLSLPTLIYVSILSVLQRPLLFFLALLLFFHHTHPAHSSTPIFIKAATALSASQNTQDRKTAFQGNSESQTHLGWKRSLEII